jgi:WD40 repeat protein
MARGDRKPRESCCLVFSPDGRNLATVVADFSVEVRSSGPQTVPATVLRGHSATMRHVSFSRDGKSVRTTSADGTWRTWDAHSGALLEKGTTDGGFAAFTSDGTRLVMATNDGARVVSRAKRETPIVVRGHDAAVLAAALSPDGRRVVTASMDRTARVWTIDWKELIARLHTSTTACLTADQRVESLEESAVVASRRGADCDRNYGRSPQR